MPGLAALPAAGSIWDSSRSRWRLSESSRRRTPSTCMQVGPAVKPDSAGISKTSTSAPSMLVLAAALLAASPVRPLPTRGALSGWKDPYVSVYTFSQSRGLDSVPASSAAPAASASSRAIRPLLRMACKMVVVGSSCRLSMRNWSLGSRGERLLPASEAAAPACAAALEPAPAAPEPAALAPDPSAPSAGLLTSCTCMPPRDMPRSSRSSSSSSSSNMRSSSPSVSTPSSCLGSDRSNIP
mmetsp:Transcript_5496/g.13917  ORF Transcript_5496/g.13917 Transcript_5496/m.13917 type:complete len:240 (-) Transcript_5496:3213-3932(-)